MTFQNSNCRLPPIKSHKTKKIMNSSFNFKFFLFHFAHFLFQDSLREERQYCDPSDRLEHKLYKHELVPKIDCFPKRTVYSREESLQLPTMDLADVVFQQLPLPIYQMNNWWCDFFTTEDRILRSTFYRETIVKGGIYQALPTNKRFDTLKELMQDLETASSKQTFVFGLQQEEHVQVLEKQDVYLKQEVEFSFLSNGWFAQNKDKFWYLGVHRQQNEEFAHSSNLTSEQCALLEIEENQSVCLVAIPAEQEFVDDVVRGGHRVRALTGHPFKFEYLEGWYAYCQSAPEQWLQWSHFPFHIEVLRNTKFPIPIHFVDCEADWKKL